MNGTVFKRLPQDNRHKSLVGAQHNLLPLISAIIPAEAQAPALPSPQQPLLHDCVFLILARVVTAIFGDIKSERTYMRIQ